MAKRAASTSVDDLRAHSHSHAQSDNDTDLARFRAYVSKQEAMMRSVLAALEIGKSAETVGSSWSLIVSGLRTVSTSSQLSSAKRVLGVFPANELLEVMNVAQFMSHGRMDWPRADEEYDSSVDAKWKPWLATHFDDNACSQGIFLSLARGCDVVENVAVWDSDDHFEWDLYCSPELSALSDEEVDRLWDHTVLPQNWHLDESSVDELLALCSA